VKGRGGSRPATPPPTKIKKKNRFYRQDDIKRFAFLYPSAEIKHLNRMVTTKIEFKKKT